MEGRREARERERERESTRANAAIYRARVLAGAVFMGGPTTHNSTSPTTNPPTQRSLNADEVQDESWLSSSFIDLILSRFAR